MAYRVIKHFCDLTDDGYVYHEGDTFPRDGLTITEERAEELSTSANRRGTPLIERIEEPIAEPIEDPVEEPKEEPVKTPKKPRKGTKKKG